MRGSYPQPINELFNNAAESSDHTSLSKIKQRALMLLKLNHTINTLLPVSLRPWCRVVNLRQNILVLETANASWMMRLLYEQNKLLSTLRTQILPALSAIDIIINPMMMTIKMGFNNQNINNQAQFNLLSTDNQHKLSKQGAILLRSVAKHSEGKLKKTLKQLAARLAGEYDDTNHYQSW